MFCNNTDPFQKKYPNCAIDPRFHLNGTYFSNRRVVSNPTGFIRIVA